LRGLLDAVVVLIELLERRASVSEVVECSISDDRVEPRTEVQVLLTEADSW